MHPSSTISSSATLQLHKVPAGCRLDFNTPPGLFAYIYRRYPEQPWQCIARNACSPHLDPTLSSLSTEFPEYVICYCDAAGIIKAASSITPNTSIDLLNHARHLH